MQSSAGRRERGNEIFESVIGRNQKIWLYLVWVGLAIFLVAIQSAAPGGGAIYDILLALGCCWLGYRVSKVASRVNPVTRSILLLSLGVLTFGYLLKYGAYLAFTNLGVDDGLALGLFQALMPPWSRGASGQLLSEALEITLCGFLGLFSAALFLRLLPQNRIAPRDIQSALKAPNPRAIVTLGVLIFLGTSLLRVSLGLRMGEEGTNLGGGMAGIITIANSYVAPNLIIYAMAQRAFQDDLVGARRFAVLAMVVGVIQYLLFYSKGAIFMPIFAVVMTQLLTKRIFSKKTLLTIGAVFLLVYPFLNIFRWLSTAGSANASNIMNSGLGLLSETGVGGLTDLMLLGLFALWGRVVGFDSLVVLVGAQDNWHTGFIDYMLSSVDLDEYLTYEIVGFQSAMGISPGHLGRAYFVGGGGAAVFASVFFCAAIPAVLMSRLFMSHALTLRPIAIVLFMYAFQLQISGFKSDVFKWWLFTGAVVFVFGWLSKKRTKAVSYNRATN